MAEVVTRGGAATELARGRSRLVLVCSIAALLGIAIWFRLVHLSRIPGISGDEGWWGIQALAWLAGRPYETHTTSGNPVDLFFLIPVALVHAVSAPSALALRLVPAAANLAALPIAFWFVRRVYGSTTAWMHTVALAILPTAIAHSRICQDPSQTVFWSGLVVYLGLLGLADRGRRWMCLAAAVAVLPVALWTHPTNVFIAPFLLLPIAPVVGARLPATRRGRAMLAGAAVLIVGAALVVARPTVAYLALWSPSLDRPWLSIAAARLADGAQLLEFAVNNGRLFNGVTVYHYFSGARPFTAPYDLAFLLVFVAAFSGFLRRRTAGWSAMDGGLLLGCLATWAAFYLFAGPHALRPHWERWSLCLLVPGTLVLTRGLARLHDSLANRQAVPAGAILLALLLLSSFYANYFGEFAATGGRSHLTYVTAPTEPKRQALNLILDRSGGAAPVLIASQQWWLSLPIQYLASPFPHVAVDMAVAPEARSGFEQALRDGRVFLVEFVASREREAAHAWVRARGLEATRLIVRDAGGRDHLEVLQVRRPG
jgi:hypothetical protein